MHDVDKYGEDIVLIDIQVELLGKFYGNANISNMSIEKTNAESETHSKKVDFKDLERLLRQSLLNKELQVVDYTATKLLPPGENYCSIMVKLDIKFRKEKSAEEEMLHLVAKTPSCTGNPIVEWPLVFKKELFMYEELRPAYKQIERDAGIEETQLIDVWPEYIGYRNSLKHDNIIDEHSSLLLKNIKSEGFYNCDRKLGLDVHHCRIALSSLARYHALGIALKQKQPKFARKATDQARVLGINFPHFDEGFDSILQTFKENPVLKKHFAVIESSFSQIKGGKTSMAMPSEPWASITHGDFWTNNILFHKDGEGNVDDVKFVDFQTYLYSSPLKDVPYFLLGSLDKETQTDYLDELIVLYYNTFIKTLKRLNCDTSPFTKESFTSELKKRAIDEFPLCALAVKFFTYENDDESKNNEEMLDSVLCAKSSDIFIEKLKWLVEIYDKMGWF